MRQKLFSYLIISVLGLSFPGCETDEGNSSGKVELYLLETYSRVDDSGLSGQIDETTLVTKDSPLINYADFLSYDSADHSFVISDEAKEAVENLQQSVTGVAFALKANDTLIYSGYFWPSTSSAICDWVVIDPITASMENKLEVRIGYPGPDYAEGTPDRRNDPRIIMIFASDGKLVK